jgi:hypothetical protein
MTTARRRAQPEAAMQRPEQAIQKALFSHIRRRGVPGLVAWHTPNGFGRRLTCIAERLERALELAARPGRRCGYWRFPKAIA